MSTKERILEEALTLFAERGYDGTGVDGIAECVGIKGPSVYRHFKSKEDILNALIDAAEIRYNESFGSKEHIGNIPQSIEDFIQTAMKKVTFTLRDPMIRKIRKLLVQEQFRNERIAEVTSWHQFDGVIGMYEKIIGGMMETGLFKEDDPAMLATQLTAPVVLMVAKVDRQPECEMDILACIEKHIRHFCSVYSKE